MTDTLYVAAKAPRPGLAKTRLASVIGEDAALTLYRAFLRDLADRFARARFPVGWYVTPADAWRDFEALIGSPGRPLCMLAQCGGDFTERQSWLFREAAARSDDRVILIGADSPQVTPETVGEAFSLLGRHDVVLGPALDGGYFLIGMRGYHDVLSGLRMSTRTVFREIVAAVQARGLSVGFVPTTFDVDDAADLPYLVRAATSGSDLPATLTALRQCGLVPDGRSPASSTAERVLTPV